MTQIEKRPSRDVVDDEQEYYPHPTPVRYKDVEDYLLITPPSVSGWAEKIQERWIVIIRPYRATLVARLWITAYWWRPCIVISIIGAVAIAIFYT